MLKSSRCGQTKWIGLNDLLAVGIGCWEIIEIGAGAGKAVAPVQLVVEKISDEIAVVAEWRDLRLDGLLGHVGPFGGIEPFGGIGDPGPEIEVLAHGDIEGMEGRIAPGAEALEAVVLDAAKGGAGPAVEVGVWYRPSQSEETITDGSLFAAVLFGLDGGDGVEEFQLAGGGHQPPDTGLIFARAARSRADREFGGGGWEVGPMASSVNRVTGASMQPWMSPMVR